jgi:translation initiation factor 1
MSENKLVYSSAPKAAAKSGNGKTMKMRLESKGRGGKSVTVLFELTMNSASAEELTRELKSKMGCGGTFKNGRIELQGDLRAKISPFLAEKGFKVIAAGG